MRHLFYLMGKSASGKDTLYEELLKDKTLNLAPLVTWTTRPIRAKEEEGVQYHFADEAKLRELRAAGKVIEERTYQTELGPWTYFTVDDHILSGLREDPEDPSAALPDLLGIGTLESCRRIREYYGQERVIPLYIEVDDGLRLERALKREKKPGNHKYEEMCRRFLADQQDFSEENLKKAGVTKRFSNDAPREVCLQELKGWIRSIQCNKEESDGRIS